MTAATHGGAVARVVGAAPWAGVATIGAAASARGVAQVAPVAVA